LKKWDLLDFMLFWLLAFAWAVTAYISLALHNSLIPKIFGVLLFISLVIYFFIMHFENGRINYQPKRSKVLDWAWQVFIIIPYLFLLYYQDWNMMLLLSIFAFGWLEIKKKLTY
jgi:hypothetical protein